MKRFLMSLACAAALCTGGAAQAALVTFNDPDVIPIDNGTGNAVYTEAGFNVSGPAASFLTIGGMLIGGFRDADTGNIPAFSLTAANGGSFTLLGFDFDFYDLGSAPGVLTVSGLMDGGGISTLSLDLTKAGHADFGADFANLTEVQFSATSGFSLDNIGTLPEPGTLALTTGALFIMGAGMGAFKRRRLASTAA